MECLEGVGAYSEFVIKCRVAVFFVLCCYFEVFQCSLPWFLADADFFLGALVCEKKIVACFVFLVRDAHPCVGCSCAHDFGVCSVDANCPSLVVAAVCEISAVTNSLEQVFVTNGISWSSGKEEYAFGCVVSHPDFNGCGLVCNVVCVAFSLAKSKSSESCFVRADCVLVCPSIG